MNAAEDEIRRQRGAEHAAERAALETERRWRLSEAAFLPSVASTLDLPRPMRSASERVELEARIEQDYARRLAELEARQEQQVQDDIAWRRMRAPRHS